MAIKKCGVTEFFYICYDFHSNILQGHCQQPYAKYIKSTNLSFKCHGVAVWLLIYFFLKSQCKHLLVQVVSPAVTKMTKGSNISLNHTRLKTGCQYCACSTQLGPQALWKSGKLCFTAGESRENYFWGSRPGKKPRRCVGSLDHSSAL